MSDARLTASNGRIAHVSLRGTVAAEQYVSGDWARIVVPLADLRATPAGPRTRQMLRGARFLVLERRDAMAFGQSEADGLVGWLTTAALGDDLAVTHRVTAPATHLYSAPDLKSPEIAALSCGALLTITGAGTIGAFLRSACGGFAPVQHLTPCNAPANDPVAVAEGLIGTPYLWGGNSRAGIDCSGLVQVACHVCAIACPPDSDLQRNGLGTPIATEAPTRRGDLVFWKGHVGWMRDTRTLLHANAHHMAVVAEPLAVAITRMGQPLVVRRL